QVALVIGVIAGALVIPPVLDLMNHAYGFMGAPGAELRPNPLPAPQAGLISSLAQGVIAADIDWSLIRTGGLIGVFIILLDEILARTTRHMRVPPLAVGLGIYLPTQSTLMVRSEERRVGKEGSVRWWGVRVRESCIALW